MSAAGGRDWARLGCAALIGALVALPIGVMIGIDRTSQQPSATSERRTAAPFDERRRNVYSPQVSSDPYVIAQHKRVVEALELSCAQSGQHCAEATQARQRVREAEGGQ